MELDAIGFSQDDSFTIFLDRPQWKSIIQFSCSGEIAISISTELLGIDIDNWAEHFLGFMT
jgi:hypothetical protein